MSLFDNLSGTTLMDFSFFGILGLPGGSEFIILAVIILVLFGSAQLPKLMFNIGRSKQALQKGLKDGIEEGEKEMEEETKNEGDKG